MALGSDYGLFFRIRVQLVIFCTIIKAQIIFELLLVLITSQLAITGQLGREIYPWRIRFSLGNRGQR